MAPDRLVEMSPPKASKRLTTAAIYRPRQGQVKNGEIAVFRGFWRELPLFGGSGTDI
jgi:hypothetical protein